MEVENEAVSVVLKPKHELLDPNFDGYKLNLGKIPIHSKQLSQGVLQAPESADDYSYQQVRLYALHNHLVQDPWNAGLNFYFSSCGTLHAAGLDESPGAESRLRVSPVLQLPSSGGGGEPAGPPTHPSLALATDRLALVSDGRGALHVAETGERRLQQPWQVASSLCPLSGRGFVLVHAAVDPAGRLHALTEHVTEKEAVPEWRPDGAEATFLNVLTWLTLEKDAAAGSWRVSRQRQAATAGTVHYSCLDPAGTALCVGAERPVSVVGDSLKPSTAPAADSAAEGSGDGTSTGTPADTKKPVYRWSQTADDVTVQLSAPVTGAGGEGVRVVLEPRELTVSVGGQTLLQGALPAAIRRDESTWTVDDGRLEVVLAKVDSGQRWSELLVGDRRGLETTDTTDGGDGEQMDTSEQTREEPESDKPGPVVGAEVEECDDLPEHSAAIWRIDGETHNATHEVSLSGHQYLMTVRLAAAEPPAFCIRHDVDGLVWQPHCQEDSYPCEHVGTLQAFGFVQASKTQRKFMTCAPDLSYALICETSRHVYIYHQPSPVDGDLRNRKSGQKVQQVSRQQVVSLEDQDPILGVTAAAGAIFVLTTSQLHALVLGGQ